MKFHGVARKLVDKLGEGHYRTLFELAPIAVYSCDSSGVIREYNSLAAELWGRKPEPGDTDERFCGSFKLYRPDGSFMPHAECPMGDVLAGRVPEIRNAEVHIERPDGSRIIAIVNISPLVDDEGKISGAINCFYDVTAQKNADEKLKRADEVLRLAHDNLELLVRERTAELEASQKGLHALSVRLLRLQDDERRRLSRELHDSAGQTLAALGMNLAGIKRQSQIQTAETNDRLNESIKLVEAMTTEMRTMSYLLHPPLLDEVGLPSGIRSFVEGFAERSKLHVELEIPELGRLSSEMETTIFRIIQECLTNIHRHSGSSTASVRVIHNSHEISVEVRDEGKGMPAESDNGSLKLGVGVQGMRERVRELGGRLEIRSGTGGTTVFTVLPIEAQTETSAENM